MNKADSSHVMLGRLGAPFGIKGWMKLISFTDPPENILAYRHFLIRLGDGFTGLEIDESQSHGKVFVAHVKGCDDRNLTRQYTGSELWIPTSELPALADEEYYWHQLEGLRVLNLDGEILGRIDRMMETGANDVMVVAPATDSVDEEERLIPWITDRVIRKVDLAAGEVLVEWDKTY